ncbi:ribonuclease P protein component [Kwoniella pini CBS 10737]|uniref:Ribonuclease P protein component n=1 Tax=Kwoniella pini CBS 10737 TaxID=1296096 RepID=A0A1B9I4L0_9TREE|nr:ribonuclease P protein component [Kwoniella pini CBS 10737]OCF50450.1 ribonuclease P protein component [Kwoniella pini CBS 10737]
MSMAYSTNISRMAQSARTFCSTCQILAIPSKLGESSRSVKIDRPRIKKGIFSSRLDPSSNDNKDQTSTTSRNAVRRGNRNIIDSVLSIKGSKQDVRSPKPGRSRRPIQMEETKAQVTAVALRKTERTLSEEHKMESIPTQELNLNLKTHFIGFDLQTSLALIFSTKLPVYKSTLFNIRCISFQKLPIRKLPPYPINESEIWKFERKCIYFTILSSKNSVSKLAVERNRCKRRFKSALNNIINGKDIEEIEQKKLLNNQYAYIASLTSKMYDAPFDQIQFEILNGLRYLQKAHLKSRITNDSLPLPKYIVREQVEVGTVPDSQEKESKVLENVF